MSDTSSPERLAANRANAQKSTGPTTPEGKETSKMNAVKHGILSREVLVAGESEEELAAFHESFRQELYPEGARQEMLVDLIVTTHWRLRRLLAMESGDITRSMEQERSEEEADRPMVPVLPSAETLNRLIRYESMLNRQLFRAMKELRTLQNQKKKLELEEWRLMQNRARRQKPQSDVPRVVERNPWAPNPEPSKVPNEPIAGESRPQTSEKKAVPLSEYGGVLSREQLRELVQMEREKGTLPPLEDAETVEPPLDTAEKLPNEPTDPKQGATDETPIKHG